MRQQAVQDEAAPSVTPSFAVLADALEQQVKAAQQELEHGVERAGLLRDPYRHLMTAQAAALGVFPALLRTLRVALDQARQPIDPSAVASLASAAASGAERQAARLARTHARRTLLLAALTLTGSVLLAGVGGFAWGYASGWRAVRVVETGVSQAAFLRGPAAASMWLGLMSANDPAQALASCSGAAVRIIDGRRACEVPLWLDPPRSDAPAMRR